MVSAIFSTLISAFQNAGRMELSGHTIWSEHSKLTFERKKILNHFKV